MAKKLPKEFIKKLRSITAKRAKTVITHILQHGFITTEELKETYGYDHPPRAIQDVKDCGIPIEMYRVAGMHGRKIAAYRFGDPAAMRFTSHTGRQAFSKQLKAQLVERDGCACRICSAKLDARYLQIDHRVPYGVAGDEQGAIQPAVLMLVCRSCNRAKSWSCEHCSNWTTEKNPKLCETCYWANPDRYTHIALQLIRRLDVVWTDAEVPDYERLLELSRQEKVALPQFVKDVLRKRLGR